MRLSPWKELKGRYLQGTREEREWVKWYNFLLTVMPCLVDIPGDQLLSEEKEKSSGSEEKKRQGWKRVKKREALVGMYCMREEYA